jgi:hypothetical protein
MVINFVTICINMILGINTIVKPIDGSSTWGSTWHNSTPIQKHEIAL